MGKDKLYEVVIRDDKGNVLYVGKHRGKIQVPLGQILKMKMRADKVREKKDG